MMTGASNSATNGLVQNRGLKIFFDGGCRPNPGRMETAVVARGMTHYQPDCGHGTNNDAEWLALIHGAKLALEIGERDIVLLGDSVVVIGQVNGVAKCRSEALRGHYEAFVALKSQFDRVRIRHIGRHQNLAGIALTKARWN